MVEQQKKRLEDAMTKVIGDVDKQFLRHMQANMHKCAAKCCENKESSMEQVQMCVERCSTTFIEAQQYVQNEFSTVQNRLQRCVLDCHDDIKDKQVTSVIPAEVDRYANQFESCAVKCVNKHVEVLPAMFQRMKQVLGEKKQLSLASVS